MFGRPHADASTSRRRDQKRDTGFHDLTSCFEYDHAEPVELPGPDDTFTAEIERIGAFHRRALAENSGYVLGG